MIIYENVKSGFIADWANNVLIDKIKSGLKRNHIGGGGYSEQHSWENSLPRVKNIIKDSGIPNDAGIAIEYKLPTTSCRIDFMISGYNEEGRGVIIVIELKQWSKVDRVENSFMVRALVSQNHVEEKAHPSRQALNYVGYLANMVEPAVEDKIRLFPCSYLHNYSLKENDPLIDSKFNTLFQKSPVFTMDTEDKLTDFIKKYIKKGDREKVIFDLDNGNIVPSARLIDDLSQMVEGKKQFYLLDSQEEVFEKAMDMVHDAIRSGEKHVLIVKGGPGTGKSVIAIQLLVNLIKEKIIANYTTPNSAPRNVYFEMLKNNDDQEYVNNLLAPSYNYMDSKTNDIPVVIVDEAHRLKMKAFVRGATRGNNQINEIINAALCSIFFIDEDQRVTDNDIGSIEEIKRCCELNNVKAQYIDEKELISQFRCKGSDGYLAWLDDVLEIRETNNKMLDTKEYDFRIIDDPDELDRLIVERNIDNKARLVAGYYKEWVSKKDKTKFDFELSSTFRKKWNLDGQTKPFAIRESSINEIGCIHTCQGLEFDYVGVILGDDIRYENGKIVSDITKNAKSDRTAMVHTKALYKKEPEKAKKIADEIIKNTYKVLMTRGLSGCYVYCEDKALSEYLKSRIISHDPADNAFAYEDKPIELPKVAEDNDEYKV